MKKVILILLINVLFFTSCDFADNKLEMLNYSGEIIIVETNYYKDNMSQGIPCTSNIIGANSSGTLTLLNRKWNLYFNKYQQSSYLEVTIVEIPKIEFDPNAHIQKYLDSKISNKEYIRYNLNLEQLDSLNWQLKYPKE
ncbi:MAG: hypothetical protein WAT79_10895 [Saprospiraceae bacterium]